MLTRILHALVADPRVYNLVMLLFGSRIVEGRLRRTADAIAAEHPGQPLTVVDVGGGTGQYQSIWSPNTRYVCVDPDVRKIEGFVLRRSEGAAIVASGSDLPLRDESVDVVMLIAVSHHLTEDILDAALAEIRRVLRPDGRFLYFDAVWNPRYLTGRLLWRYDRGAFPRPPEVLQRFLARHFTCQSRERYGVLHDYITWIGKPVPTA